MIVRRRLISLILLVLAASAAGSALLIGQSRSPCREPAAPVREVLLFTGLPLLFGEGFSLDNKPAPIAAHWQTSLRLRPIDLTDSKSLANGDRLIMAQPRAQAPEQLVALDQWVRSGGRALIFADPRLEWPTELAITDPLRPPPMFADTGLLARWGLHLDAPDKRGPVKVTINGLAITALSPGTLVAAGDDCSVTAGGLVARCRIGQGEVTIVADADVLDLDRAGSTNREGIDSLLESLRP